MAGSHQEPALTEEPITRGRLVAAAQHEIHLRKLTIQQFADRAYKKLKEGVEYEVSEYREVSEKAIIERIQQLEAQLGYVRRADGETARRLPDVRVVD